MISTDTSTQGNTASPPPDATQQHLHNLAQEAGATLDEAKAQGAQQYAQYRDLAAEQLDSLVEGAQSAAGALEGKDSLGLSQYLTQLAGGLGSFADQVRDQSAEQLLHKGAQLARDNPALFLAGSVAIGFGLSRFLGASAKHPPATPATEAGADSPTPYASATVDLSTSSEPTAATAAAEHAPADIDPLGITRTIGMRHDSGLPGGV
jgi:hypothetical protein